MKFLLLIAAILPAISLVHALPAPVRALSQDYEAANPSHKNHNEYPNHEINLSEREDSNLGLVPSQEGLATNLLYTIEEGLADGEGGLGGLTGGLGELAGGLGGLSGGLGEVPGGQGGPVSAVNGVARTAKNGLGSPEDAALDGGEELTMAAKDVAGASGNAPDAAQ
ncbi:hypothetical protein DFH07DRAFT_769342 [Mycena maculata]|uniref:Uncharacterized protein n=1 Tax=Mycena maculata TaxID=230809 RepID=A0AAD7NMK2_9AGAR|nr:hypothetical protein DFH07DRAFT_769342 [Mycena maculata]